MKGQQGIKATNEEKALHIIQWGTVLGTVVCCECCLWPEPEIGAPKKLYNLREKVDSECQQDHERASSAVRTKKNLNRMGDLYQYSHLYQYSLSNPDSTAFSLLTNFAYISKLAQNAKRFCACKLQGKNTEKHHKCQDSCFVR
jgi:hypothetical protein